jgi:hypothetical protein
MRIVKFLSLALRVARKLCCVEYQRRFIELQIRGGVGRVGTQTVEFIACRCAKRLRPASRLAVQSRCAHKRLRINLCFQKDSVLPRQLKTDHKLRACVVRRAKVPHAHTPLWNKHTKGGRVGERYWIAGGADLETFSPRAAER